MEANPSETIRQQTKHHQVLLQQYRAGEFNSGRRTLPYRHFLPIREKADGQEKLPLVLWLHGIKGRGNDNEKQLIGGDNLYGPAYFTSQEVQDRFPCHVLVPQCPGNKLWINFATNSSTRTLRQVVELVQHCIASENIDPDRIYVAGQSMGGFGTWVLLTEFPEMFAAGVPISGGGSPRKAKRRIQAPVWAFHGVKDPLVRVHRSRSMVNAIESELANYTEFQEGRHNIWPRIFSGQELADWLFAQDKDLAES